jgi:hypothetical protein
MDGSKLSVSGLIQTRLRAAVRAGRRRRLVVRKRTT